MSETARTILEGALHPPLILASDDATEVAAWFTQRIRAALAAPAEPQGEWWAEWYTEYERRVNTLVADCYERKPGAARAALDAHVRTAHTHTGGQP